MNARVKIVRPVRRVAASMAVAAAVLLSPAAASAQGDVLANEPVVPLPTELPSLGDDPVGDDDPDLVIGTDLDPAETVDDVDQTLNGEKDEGPQTETSDDTEEDADPSGASGDLTTTRGEPSVVDGTTTGAVPSSTVDEPRQRGDGVRLAPAKSYTGVIADGALATAERALHLAGSLAPPLLLAGFAFVILIAIARGNDRLVKIERAPERRTYKL